MRMKNRCSSIIIPLTIVALAGITFLTIDDPLLAQMVPPPSPPPNRTAAATGVLVVKYEGALLSVKAERADLAELLRKVSLAAGIPIDVGPGVSAIVTVEFVGLNLEEGVNRILAAAGENNLATEYTKQPGQKKDEYRIDKIVVMRRGAAATPALESIANRDREYREFFAQMDKEGNKIARALKEYKDPGISPDKKIKLRTFLRQTSVDDPADKKLLKGASLDPQYKEILSELHLALLHAIQDKPEESDKEYILDLLRRDIAPGWLLYGMLKIWDDRYVPYLLDYVRRGSPTAIEILGRAQAKEAVPLLEKALDDKNGEVRKAAYYALFNITGKKYEYKPVLRDQSAPENQGGR